MLLSYIFNYINNVFYLDLRSLALFRIGLGAFSLLNLFWLFPYLDAFYGINGLAPLAALKPYMRWSFYAFGDNHYFIHAVFFFHVVAAMLLLLGKFTRVATAACLLLTISYVHRFNLVTYGADTTMIAFLMWGIFLPLGSRFSLDALKNKSINNLPNRFVSMVTAAFFIQIVFVYVFNAIGKNDFSWWRDYTALFYTLSCFEWASSFGAWLVQFPDFLKVLTFLALMLEFWGSFLLLIPVYSALFRNIAIIIFIGFHFSIFLTMTVGWFSGIMIVVWSALIPSTWWQRTKISMEDISLVRRRFNKPVVCVVSFVLIFFLIQNTVLHLTYVLNHKVKHNVAEAIGKTLGIHQKWMMFVPYPPKTTRKYYYVPIYADEALASDARLTAPIEIKENERWTKFLFNLRSKRNHRYRLFLINYLTTRWNATHPSSLRVKTVRVYFSVDWISPIKTVILVRRYFDIFEKPLMAPL